MAKLTKQLANQAEAQKDEVPDFSPVPPGVYLCKLREVDTSRSGPAGPYWTWEFETVGANDEPEGKRFWDNTSLSEKAIGRVGKMFEAFGLDATHDTDESIGHLVAVEVKIGTIKSGDNAGNKRNEVTGVFPPEVHAFYEEYAEATDTGGSSAGDFD